MNMVKVRNTDYKMRFFGYVHGNMQYVVEKIVQEDIAALIDVPGNYVIAVENDSECHVATSPYGVWQYYYMVKDNKLFHDDTVIGVLKKSLSKWSWNYSALADLAQLDHMLENDTLHPDVFRVPAGSIMSFKGGRLKIVSSSWEDVHPDIEADPDYGLKIFNDEVRRCLSDNTAISMSGGLDSRLMLSSALKNGCRPLLLTMGYDNTTDVVIVRRIASKFNLPSLVVSITPEDCVAAGRTITGLTNGTKTLLHWHTYVYSKKSGSGQRFRSFYGD